MQVNVLKRFAWVNALLGLGLQVFVKTLTGRTITLCDLYESDDVEWVKERIQYQIG